MTGTRKAPANIVAGLGGVILMVVLAYYVFTGIDSFGLADQNTRATVLGKRYQEAGTTYVTQTINNRPQVIPRTTPGVHLLQLQIEEKRVEAPVSKELFEMVSKSDAVQATYQRTRLTQSVQVINVKRQE
jgi:hypothetical protein